jgi:hypothetical protein
MLAFCSNAISCSNNNNDCISYQTAPVTRVESPATGLINQDIPITVYFGIFSGCGQFSSFESFAEADTTFIRVKAKYAGCICTEIAGTLSSAYTFRSSQPGTFYFKFESGQDILRDTVVIQ